MTRIELHSRVDSDGNLRLDVPVGTASANRDVVVTISPVEKPAAVEQSQDEWRKFIESVAGTWEGEPFERPPQGKLEERDSWD